MDQDGSTWTRTGQMDQDGSGWIRMSQNFLPAIRVATFPLQAVCQPILAVKDLRCLGQPSGDGAGGLFALEAHARYEV